MNIIDFELPNKYKVNVIEKSKIIIDEVWNEKIYERDFKIKKGMTIIDIGANQGFFSLYAANKGAYVYAVEPEKTNFQILKNNIEMNGLQDFIKPYNYAVSTKKGQTEILVMDYNITGASGMVTTSEKYLSTINKNSGEIKKEKIDCIRLDEFLEKINIEKIDLLKIDCEGAEIDILQSAEKKYFKNINNIVMETHGNYEEKDIFYIIKNLGFNILGYEKLNGIYKIGYLYANNKLFNQPSIKNPIAIIKNDPVIVTGIKHCFDSSQSFSAINKDSIFKYQWYINNKVEKNNKSKLYHTFTNPGKYKIGLKIFENEYFCEEEKIITVYDNNYFQKKEIVNLPGPEDLLKIKLLQKTYFCIKKDLFPKDWMPEHFSLSIRFSNPKNTGGIFLFNNENVNLSDVYNEIRISDFSREIDLIFSIENCNNQEIDIIWWPDKINNETKKITIDKNKYKSKGIISLPDKSIEYNYYSSKLDKFVIHKEYLPAHWNPKYIVIGISYCEKGIHNYNFELNGDKYKLSVNYKEIKLDADKIKSDFIFTIKILKRNKKMKIVWWAE